MVQFHHYTPFHKTSYKTIVTKDVIKAILWLQLEINLIRQFPETSILKILIHKHVHAVQCNPMFLLNQYIGPNT